MEINGKGFGRKRSWHNLRYYYAVIVLQRLRKTTKNQSAYPVAGAENRTLDLLNTKQECKPLDHDVQSDYAVVFRAL
jgi:hypothetical protein